MSTTVERDVPANNVFPARKILCVQQDNDSCAVLAEAMVEHQIVFAHTAYDALRSMHLGTFDLYVLDFWLPDWSGLSLCRTIRKADPHVPVVFCTAASAERDRARALRAGASAYFTKPIDTGALHSRVCELLEWADRDSLRARPDAQQAVDCELLRWVFAAHAHPLVPEHASLTSMERTARPRACEAFIRHGGTHAHFERWWPQLFASAHAGQSARVPVRTIENHIRQ